jgi:hypothetical protein
MALKVLRIDEITCIEERTNEKEGRKKDTERKDQGLSHETLQH